MKINVNKTRPNTLPHFYKRKYTVNDFEWTDIVVRVLAKFAGTADNLLSGSKVLQSKQDTFIRSLKAPYSNYLKNL